MLAIERRDSLSRTLPPKRFSEKIRQFLIMCFEQGGCDSSRLRAPWAPLSKDVPRQVNGRDCGVSTVMQMLACARGVGDCEHSYTGFDMVERCRYELMYQLKHRALLPAPGAGPAPSNSRNRGRHVGSSAGSPSPVKRVKRRRQQAPRASKAPANRDFAAAAEVAIREGRCAAEFKVLGDCTLVEPRPSEHGQGLFATQDLCATETAHGVRGDPILFRIKILVYDAQRWQGQMENWPGC